MITDITCISVIFGCTVNNSWVPCSEAKANTNHNQRERDALYVYWIMRWFSLLNVSGYHRLTMIWGNCSDNKSVSWLETICVHPRKVINSPWRKVCTVRSLPEYKWWESTLRTLCKSRRTRPLFELFAWGWGRPWHLAFGVQQTTTLKQSQLHEVSSQIGRWIK